jgi:DUF1680 family protein
MTAAQWTVLLKLVALAGTVALIVGHPLAEDGAPRGGSFAMNHAKLIAVPFTRVRIRDGFWSQRLEVNRTRTLPHNLAMCEETGRLRNFTQAAGLDPSPYQGHYFHDSDVYKVIEGAAYCLATHPDDALEARLDTIIDHIARAQQPDGYLNTWFTLKEPDKRWTDLPVKHELYCAGHLFEAAVAHYEATGKSTLLDVACRFADHIDSVFGPGKRHGVPGHEEIELALIKLWRVTGENRYLRLAQFFVEERGRAETHTPYGDWCQDHLPVRQQTEAVGHCVRAMYLYSAVADLAAITGDAGYVSAMEALWQDIVNRKMYVTGGIGVEGHGEGFARPYFLPNYDAYCETCAAIGMAFWNHRLLLLHGEGRFADVFERVLYNGLLSGVSLDGVRFFYVNPLASHGNHHRQSWYGCACCPTNVVRFLPVLGGYIYATSATGDGVWVIHYVASEATVNLGAVQVILSQDTRYPWEGNVRVTVNPSRAAQFSVHMRVPSWCSGAKVSINGQITEGAAVEQGFLKLTRVWQPGDVVELELPMPVRRIEPQPEVEENRGRVALQRGPIVYCLEDGDHDLPVSRIALPGDASVQAEWRPNFLGGVVVLRGQGMGGFVFDDEDGRLKYEPRPVEVTAIPYYAWDNRTSGQMIVWIPTKLDAYVNLSNASLAAVARPSASHCHSTDSIAALNDGILPQSSIDHTIPRFTWWDHRGTQEWVAYEFDKPRTFSRTEVYWFDDTGRGQCRVPASWRLLWLDGEHWRPVEADGPYGVERDKFNVVTFKPVRTMALRLEVTLQEGFSGGILEWRVSRS